MCLADVLGEVGEAAAGELAAKYGEDKVCFELCDVTKQDQFECKIRSKGSGLMVLLVTIKKIISAMKMYLAYPSNYLVDLESGEV